MSVHLPKWRGGRCCFCFCFPKQSLLWHLQLDDVQMTAGPLMTACLPLQGETQAEGEVVKLEEAGMCQAPQVSMDAPSLELVLLHFMLCLLLHGHNALLRVGWSNSSSAAQTSAMGVLGWQVQNSVFLKPPNVKHCSGLPKNHLVLLGSYMISRGRVQELTRAS